MPPFSTGNEGGTGLKKTLSCKALDRTFLFQVINLSSLSHTLRCRLEFLHANEISKIHYNYLPAKSILLSFAFTFFKFSIF